MTVTLPTPDNDYQAPLVMAVSRAVWDAVFASVGSRIRALEATTADYEAVVSELETQALAVISATITDEINTQRAKFDALSADADALADEIAEIRNSGIIAANVNLSAIAGLAAANAQAAIAELLGKIEDADLLLAPAESPTFTGTVTLPNGTTIGPSTPAGGNSILRSARTSNTVLSITDNGSLIDITSGTFTQTFAAAATLGNGWWCYLKNSVSELISVPVNGNFDTDTGWSKGAGWTISGGAAVASAAMQAFTATPAPLSVGKRYRIKFSATVSSGQVVTQAGTSATLVISASGKYEYEVTATSTTLRFYGATAFTGTIDNLTVEEIATADITLAPNGAETIDGLTSFIMYPGEVRLIQCDGTALRSIVVKPFSKTFTGSDNFIKPPGYSDFEGLLWGGGASGARRASGTNRPGGGGGGCAPLRLRDNDLAASTAVIIGAGGAAQTSNDSAGLDGGNSSFAGITAYGGKKGDTSNFNSTGGNALINLGINYAPVTGGSNGSFAAYYGGGNGFSNGNQGSSVYGGTGGNGITSGNVLLISTTSVYGGDGGWTDTAGTYPSPGAAPGGGGAASTNGTKSGAGARGEMRIWGII